MADDAVGSQNSVLYRLLNALTNVDCDALNDLVAESIAVAIPGARDLDITLKASGRAALCAWSKIVHDECGNMKFVLHRYFENECEMMAIGNMNIQRIPRVFECECGIHVRFECGKVASFKLFFDTYALEKFRGQMD